MALCALFSARRANASTICGHSLFGGLTEECIQRDSEGLFTPSGIKDANGNLKAQNYQASALYISCSLSTQEQEMGHKLGINWKQRTRAEEEEEEMDEIAILSCSGVNLVLVLALCLGC